MIWNSGEPRHPENRLSDNRRIDMMRKHLLYLFMTFPSYTYIIYVGIVLDTTGLSTGAV
jgi:hypothetical protein